MPYGVIMYHLVIISSLAKMLSERDLKNRVLLPGVSMSNLLDRAYLYVESKLYLLPLGNLIGIKSLSLHSNHRRVNQRTHSYQKMLARLLRIQ